MSCPRESPREGFNFKGWRVSESLVLQPGAPWPADFPAENDSTVTVWAEWEQIQQSDELQEDAPVLLPPSGGENSATAPSEPLTTEPPEPPRSPGRNPSRNRLRNRTARTEPKGKHKNPAGKERALWAQ